MRLANSGYSRTMSDRIKIWMQERRAQRQNLDENLGRRLENNTNCLDIVRIIVLRVNWFVDAEGGVSAVGQ